MAIKVTIPQADQQFPELMEQVLKGEEIIICEDSEEGTPLARIIPSHISKQKRIPGQDRGKILIAADFNAPLPDDILADFIH